MERMSTAQAMKAFEKEEVLFETDFGEALKHLKNGGKAARHRWAENGMWIRLVEPEGTSDFDYGMVNSPYLELKTMAETLIPWVASQEDLLAEDWMLLEEEEV